MKRILLSFAIIIAASSSAIAASGTGAFFSDTESSLGNLFTAGAIDLKVDNHSFYNGNECKEVTAGVFQWVGTAGFPLPGTPCTTSWSLDDLQNGQGITLHKFFDFQDIKPSDYSEDTISLHMNGNDSYLCANVTLTSNDENSCTTPELKDEPGCTSPGLGLGQLAQNVNFIWWADLNGDNVLESNEQVISSGPIGALTIGATTTVTLADSGHNIWNPGGAGGSLAAGTTTFIGKAWCFGAISAAPLPPGTFSPAGDGNGNTIPGEPADGGYLCNGATLNNSTQTDSLTADVTFNAVQARHNDGFLCTRQCVVASTTNLVTDGGFESPVVANAAQWDIFPSPVNGWNVAWRDASPTTFSTETRPTIANLELHRGVLGPAVEGQQYAELDTDWGGPADPVSGEPAAVVITQVIPTIPGASYKLHFQFAPRPSTAASENELGVTWGGTTQPTVGPTAGGAGNPVFAAFDYTVVATSTQTQISFTDLGSPNDSQGTFLDDVSVTQQTCAPQN